MPKNSELPGMEGEGVALLEIAEIDKAISKYQRKKEARCKETPGEIESKRELRVALHKHRDKLLVTAEGVPFYRHDDRDYFLEEKLTVKKVESADDDDD